MTDSRPTHAVETVVATVLDAPLQELIRALTLSEGEFMLLLALCNSASLRQQLMHQLHQRQPYPIADVLLPPDAASLYQAVMAEAARQPAAKAMMVANLETVTELDALLAGD